MSSIPSGDPTIPTVESRQAVDAGERLRPTSPAAPQPCRVQGCWRKQTSGHLVCSYHLHVLKGIV